MTEKILCHYCGRLFEPRASETECPACRALTTKREWVFTVTVPKILESLESIRQKAIKEALK